MVEKQLMKCENCSNMQFYVWTSGLPHDDAEYQCNVCDSLQSRYQKKV